MLTLYGTTQGTSRNFLRFLLTKELGIKSLPEVARSPTGKPYFPHYPDLHFNISHSGTYLLCALGAFDMGVDIELICPRSPKLPRYALTEQEYRDYLKRGGDWAAFYGLWTRREAFVKYTGQGLGKAWREDFDGTALFWGTYEGFDYRATLCSSVPAPEKIIWLNEGGC